MEQGAFSIVVLIAERDRALVPRVLPSWLALGSSDVVLGVDEPASLELREVIESVAKGDPSVRILEVPFDPRWKYRMAEVRRKCFSEARYDRILTGDIDILVNKACLRAVDLVGKDDIGLVSLEKRRGAGTVGEAFRNVTKKALKVTTRRHFFTGLYALYRPYWIDSEDQEVVRKILPPSNNGMVAEGVWYVGEDVILRDAVGAKHKLLYLPVVGGKDITISFEDKPHVQKKLAQKLFEEGRSFSYVLVSSVIYARARCWGRTLT